MLDNAEVLSLVEQAQHGKEEAKTILINEIAPLIKSVIKRFKGRGVEYDDLYQLGCIGFLKALKNFNVDFGVKFSTYVVPMVIGEIKRFMRDDGSIKVSRALKSLNIKINQYINESITKNQKSPTIDEISRYLQVDEQDVILAMESSKMPMSLESPMEDGEGNSVSLGDKIEAESDNDIKIIDKIVLKDSIKSLDERDKKIIIMRYYLDKTQSEIAKILQISQVQVSRLECKILKELHDKIL